MNIKQITAAIAVMLLCANALVAQSTWGFHIGHSKSHLLGSNTSHVEKVTDFHVSKDDDGYDDGKSGVRVGGFYGFKPIEMGWLWSMKFEIGCYLSMKGSSYDFEDLKVKIKTNLNYIEVPLNIVFAENIYEDWYARFYYGAYVGFGVFGNQKCKIDGSIDKTLTISSFEGGNNKYGVPNLDFKTIDIGLQTGLGIEIYGIYFGYQISFGLTELNGNKFETKLRNMTSTLELGYHWGRIFSKKQVNNTVMN